MKIATPTLLACTVILASALRARAQEPPAQLKPDDFAYAIELTPRSSEPVQTLLVPLAVYRSALRPDLGDLRVFNAAQQVLPHALRKLDAPAPVDQPLAEREHKVPLFPLFAPADAPVATVDALALRVERTASGSVIDIRSDPEHAPDAGQPAATRVIAYILDTQAIDRDMISLRVRIDETPAVAGKSYLASVVIDVSNDLSSWSTIALDGVLARLAHQGQLVTRDRIELGGIRYKFLRVRSVVGADIPGRIAEAWVEVAQGAAPARARERLRVRGTASEEPGVFDYDLGGAFPVERVRVVLPSTNLLIQAEVSVAAAKGESEPARKVSAIRARTSKRIYDDVFDGPIYRLQQEGRELESPAIELDSRRVRYVSITIGEDTALEEPPEIEIEYLPAQLLFVARDPQPYSLAYGSYAAQPSKMSADTLLAPFKDSSTTLALSSVQLGQTTTLAGEAALTAPPPPPPIKTYVLWGVLIAGTLAITALALRLVRKLDA
jgi:hypothetical protein